MSCDKCDEAQNNGNVYFMRIGRANVAIVACEEHFREVQRLIKAGMAVDDDKSLEV